MVGGLQKQKLRECEGFQKSGVVIFLKVSSPALLSASPDDGHELDVVGGDVPAAPARHVEVLVHDRDADVLLRHLLKRRRKAVTIIVALCVCLTDIRGRIGRFIYGLHLLSYPC